MSETSEGSWNYVGEGEFIKYFNRCREIGMTSYEIRKNCDYLKKLYKKMVLINYKKYHNNISIGSLLTRWESGYYDR